jgi:hypothetical protein
LINNRQGGRRRGRGGQGGGRNLGGGQPGNRQDNRQRGNAAQLLEKYKSMARDAQLAGDRVQSEYYLQYADHYFRVLSESRSRFEEQNPRRSRDDDMDRDDGDEEMAEAGDVEASADDRPQRRDRPEGRDRSEGRERFPRRDRQSRDERDERDARDEERAEADHMNGGETIPFDVLPPAIGRDEPEARQASDDEPAPKRRRTRAARPAEGDEEIAPVA